MFIMTTPTVQQLAIQHLTELGESTTYFYAIGIHRYASNAVTLQGDYTKGVFNAFKDVAELSLDKDSGYIEGAYEYKGITIRIILTN
jgi:hypothetical protein